MENLNWLFYAYGIGIGLLFVYIFQISRREQSLRRRIADLQALVDDRWKK
jgi:CcmD family protein